MYWTYISFDQVQIITVWQHVSFIVSRDLLDDNKRSASMSEDILFIDRRYPLSVTLKMVSLLTIVPLLTAEGKQR